MKFPQPLILYLQKFYRMSDIDKLKTYFLYAPYYPPPFPLIDLIVVVMDGYDLLTIDQLNTKRLYKEEDISLQSPKKLELPKVPLLYQFYRLHYNKFGEPIAECYQWKEANIDWEHPLMVKFNELIAVGKRRSLKMLRKKYTENQLLY